MNGISVFSHSPRVVFEGNLVDNRLCISSSHGGYLSCCGSLFVPRKRTWMRAGDKKNPAMVFERQSIAVFFKGADTKFFCTTVLGLDSKIQPRVSQDDVLEGNTANGSWRTVVAHLTTRCLCIDQVAVTRLVGPTRWLVTRFILRGCMCAHQ